MQTDETSVIGYYVTNESIMQDYIGNTMHYVFKNFSDAVRGFEKLNSTVFKVNGKLINDYGIAMDLELVSYSFHCKLPL